MKVSQAGILLIVGFLLIGATGCNFFARKNVVDGAEAFKNRKFDEAEALFRTAVKRAPADSVEGKTAQLFLARTLHSKFAADRSRKELAEEAISEYQKVLAVSPSDNSSFKAVANLYENLGKMDEWRKWLTERSDNTQIPPEQRAEAYTTLAAKENTCANDISDVEPVKKTVQKDGKPVFVFNKPEKPEDLEKLKQCVAKGTELVSKAMQLETEQVKTAKSVNIKPMSDKDLKALNEMLKPFESTRSYNTSLLIQSMRLAEMEGRTADRDRFKTEADAAREQFKQLGEITKAIKDELDERAKAAEAAAGGPANTQKK